ncbi:MAG: hypothetical protein E3J35_08240 [Methanomassiliicoccales archaeon]|nr:MAG: hypothetical protein E3J35_08240 [Methanomassiliicoccales archaeon]
MIIETEKIHRQKDIQNELEELGRGYGSIEALHQRVSVDKCGSPFFVDDYILWRALRTEGCEYIEKIEIDTPEIFADLSPRRLELLEYVRMHDVKSITDLAGQLNRNYKNVYDDLSALQKWGLVTLSRRGKDKKPVSQVETMKVTFRR